MPAEFSLQTETWLSVGVPNVADLGGKEIVRKAIDGLEWLNLSAYSGGKGLKLPFSQGWAIKYAIQQLNLKPLAIAYETKSPIEQAVYGIRAKHANGISELYFVDSGISVTPVLTVFHPKVA